MVVLLLVKVMRQGFSNQIRMICGFVIEDVVEACEKIVVLVLREQLLFSFLRDRFLCLRILAQQYLFYFLPYFGVGLMARESMVDQILNFGV